MKNLFYYGKQTIEQSDIDAVVNVLPSPFITQGPKSVEFENELKKFFGAKYASVVANGTASLHLIALALQWKKGDIIITSPITFLSSANCAIFVGATVDFVDINPKTYTIDTTKLEDKLKYYSSINKKVKAVVAVDFAGYPSDWKTLASLKNKYGFQLVNDFCHALGAEYFDDIQYAVKYADAVNFSFHPVKHITTGEGGAVLTNNELIDKRVKLLRTHGMTKDENELEKNDGPWYYEMHEVGFNYRITDFQCALGINQLKRLKKFIASRRKVAEYYDSFFKNDDRVVTPFVSKNVKHAYHLYPLQIKFDKLKIDKKEFYFRLKENGVVFQVHYIPVHLQPFYRKKFGFKAGDFPVAEKFYESEISIPIYPTLTKKDLKFITNAIKKTLDSYK
ncbi:UDP-4-amino-4,6-dideoxy-N-acetyl-beta-L-altrosamine transaminase [Stygiobacter electus]|uniref:UDP-4-amino-4, 6-dideoxy-N-acetyl-beta-L-altrosamine transaminase n=1 Tax=Stygiobacter electus TaxID=3032292 RepID=A0AAE3P0B9_9BACT|nr:UDP-4-amino-4,6-dideoxy-N-acetyl-beta-L-altrosamine transaminase [Stygiobacter electus]MDF1611974.1 UDP-4-amino-4,6-dideoxy-N-acetyl-beta-L-altrosamine transaminase [Stygiobacter electus]